MFLPKITFSQLSLPSEGVIILFLFQEQIKTAFVEKLDHQMNGSLNRAISIEKFTGKFGEVCHLLSPTSTYTHIVLVGLGKETEFSKFLARQAGGIAARTLQHKVEQMNLLIDQNLSEYSEQFAVGCLLSAYAFDLYQTDQSKKEKNQALKQINLFASNPTNVESNWEKELAVIEGAYIARDLVNEPANTLNPPEFAKRIQQLENLGLKIEILNREQMQKLGFGALLGVAQGSDAEARVAIMHWNGNSEDQAAPLAFLGKGVTFDSGGISIKPAGGMDEMKMDMAGAAAVVGLMSALAKRKAKVNAIGVVGLVENMLSGNAQRPGDIVRTASGKTVEVLNTDAEGRLVLADILWYTQDRFKPRFMIDLATLTGAIVVALGHEYAGLFSNNDELAERLSSSGKEIGEKLWRMPLAESYDKAIDSDIADIKNIGGRDGGSITAAQFLQRFVNEVPWAHLDIAGTAYTSKIGNCNPKGATAFGVCLLNQLIQDYYEG